MGKLSILGAKRVEALQVILDQQCEQEINDLNAPIPKSSREKEQVVIDSYAKKNIDIQKLLAKYNDCIDKIRSVIEANAYRTNKLDIATLYNDLLYKQTPEYKKYLKHKEDITKKYNEKKNQLWLCETLEDAKQIVGIN